MKNNIFQFLILSKKENYALKRMVVEILFRSISPNPKGLMISKKMEERNFGI